MVIIDLACRIGKWLVFFLCFNGTGDDVDLVLSVSSADTLVRTNEYFWGEITS